jgi:hypothetical protein
MSNPPAGWYPDPTGQPNTIRWWNGTQWTNRTDTDPAADSAESAEPNSSNAAARTSDGPASTT